MDDNQLKPGQVPDQSIPPPRPQSEKDEDLPHLRTMKHDAARYLKDRNLSFLDLVAKEHESAEERLNKFRYHERVTEKLWFRGILGLVILILLATGGYGIYVFFLTRDTLPPTEASPARAAIPVEEREIITIRDGDRAGLLAKLEAARRNRLPSRSLKHVVVRIESFGGNARFASARDFLQTLDFKTPSGFVENLNDKIDILIYYRPDGADVGLLFQPRDNQRAFSQMLEWENTIMLDFRSLYFDKNVSQPFHLFTDKVVRNVDMRTISLEENATFSYALFAQRLLVIALSEESMEVLLGRLLATPPR